MRKQKITNHSARKTTVRKFKSFGFPKCEIKNIIGHNSVNVDLMYVIPVMKIKCLQCHQQYLNLSILHLNCCSKKKKKEKRKIKPSPSPEQSKHDFCRTFYPTPVKNNTFSFRINWNDVSQSQLSKPFGTCSPGTFSFDGCQVNININNNLQPQQNNNAKRKRHTIYSDLEESQD